MSQLDVRLLPLAVALWLGCATGLHTALSTALLAGGLSCIAAGCLAMVRRHWSVTLFAAALCGLVLAGLRVDSAAPGALQEFIANAGVVRFVAVIDSEPQRVERSGFGGVAIEPAMLARATLIEVQAGDRWHVSVPVTLQWSPDGARHAVGEHVRGFSLPQQGDAAQRSAFWIRVQGPLHVVQHESHGAWLASRVRDGLALATRAGTGGDGAALLPGLVLGDTRAQTPQLVDDLRLSGLSHLTAVSGANLAIIVGALMWSLARTRIRRRHRFVLLLFAIAGFVAVVQPQPSVVRAAIMSAISLFALATGARKASASVLWLSVCLLLIIDPFLAWQWGFALSVAATSGLVVIAPLLSRFLGRGRVRSAMAVALSAQLATLPVLLAMGRPPTWLSIPANLLCEPLVAPATVSGFLAAVIAGFALIPNPVLAGALMWLASLVAWPGVRMADVIAWVAHHGVSTPLATAPIRSLWALVALLAALLGLRRLGASRRVLALIVVFASLVSIACPDGLHRWPQRDWWFAMCDVGQGDAAVVNLGHGAALLIDAGPDASLERRCLRQLGVQRVAALFITHFHADHVEGLSGALQEVPIARVFATPLHEPAIEWSRTRKVLPMTPTDLTEGDNLRFGDVGIRVLWPSVEALTGDPNHASLVLDIERAGVHILATGDADAAAQVSLRLPVSRYAVIKVPHHGSRFQDMRLPSRTHPALALVSVGAGNDYGHPADATIDNYRNTGVQVLRTDLVGAISVAVRGDAITFATMSH